MSGWIERPTDASPSAVKALKLDADEFVKLERLSVAVKQRIRGTQQGRRRSRMAGSSLEFADYRQYAPGDDVRQIDWNAYGRTGKPFVKLFLDERELTVHLYVDASASMNTGGVRGENKFVYARQLAACIGYMALAGYDLVSASFFGDRLTARLPPLRGKGAIHRLIDFLHSAQPETQGDIAAALSIASLPRQPGMAWVFSDFWFESGVERALSALVAARQEVVAVQVLSPEELRPELAGDLRLIDVETGTDKEVAMSDAVLEKYRRALEQYTTELRRFCHARGIGYVLATTDVPAFDWIASVLRREGLIV